MDSKFHVNDAVFILDMEWGRVFPAIITRVKHNPDVWYSSYKVKLDPTPGVHDELAFNGIAKPCPFSIPNDKWFSDDELYTDKIIAYQELVEECDREQERLKEHIGELEHCKKLAQDRVVALMKAENTKYKIGDTVWFISKGFYEDPGKVVEVTIVKYDRGDFQNKPYYVRSKRTDLDTAWCGADQLYDSRKEAVTALKKQLKSDYELKLARAVAE